MDVETFTANNPNVKDWLDGEKQPTFNQLEAFSRKVHLPFGYLMLKEPPIESLPIPFFRTNNTPADRVSLNIYDTILILQQRQDWLREYLRDKGLAPLLFVGSYGHQNPVVSIADDIRTTLGLQENWASFHNTWQDALDHLVRQIEEVGIITVFNGVVENNPHRKIPVDECRGFVLVDNMAPFMFINNDDFKSAQMFTIVHELAHIWVGRSAGFDFRKLQPSNDPVEILCDKVAAEFLVPSHAFNEVWSRQADIRYAARTFKVSEIVIARRALDTGKISQSQFYRFYDEYSTREFVKKENQGDGGNFYATARKRISVTFAAHVKNALNAGQLLVRDAYKLTSLRGDTFHTFITQHI